MEEKRLTTSGSGSDPKSSEKSIPLLKHGEEPTGLLLALASSPIETLCQRNQASVFTANGSDGQPVVLVVFNNTLWRDGVLVLAN